MAIPLSKYDLLLDDIPDTDAGDEGFAISDADEIILNQIVSTAEKPTMTEQEIKNY
jgi:hypothetical protein